MFVQFCYFTQKFWWKNHNSSWWKCSTQWNVNFSKCIWFINCSLPTEPVSFSSPPTCGTCSPGLLVWFSFSWQWEVSRLWKLSYLFFLQEWWEGGLLEMFHPLLRYESKAEQVLSLWQNRFYLCVRTALPAPGKVAGERGVKHLN